MEWKDIKGYEGIYQVSDTGLVRSLNRFDALNHKLKEKILSCGDNGRGYKFLGLCKNNKVKRYYVHRLVAEAFIPNPENKPEVNHKDGNKSNNTTSNLEWMTGIENIRHARATGLVKFTKETRKKQSITKIGGKNPMAKKIMCIETGQIFDSVSEANIYLGVCRTAVANAIKRNGKCQGYSFKFI